MAPVAHALGTVAAEPQLSLSRSFTACKCADSPEAKKCDDKLIGRIVDCRESAKLSKAGRRLFGSSRERKKTANDADRLRKYLARFGLNWQDLRDNN